MAVIFLILCGCQGHGCKCGTVVIHSGQIDNQILVYTLKTDYQYGPNNIFAILPDKREPNQKFPVLYILPVSSGSEAALAGLKEALRLNLHNRYHVIFVAPAFEKMPWYADHPTDKNIRQESYFLDAVVPFIDKTLPAYKTSDKRYLLGFSKSGWGAWSLLLRHPDNFSRAVSWDAPLAMNQAKDYNSPDIFGTQENFEQYRIINLLHNRAMMRQKPPARLVLLGYGYFEQDDLKIHQMMNALDIPHYWDHGPKRIHSWDSGWLEPAVDIVMQNRIESNTH